MVEIFNCRVTFQRHNQEAAEFAAHYGIPGIAASDSHSAMEVAMAFNAMPHFETADELRRSPPGQRLARQPLDRSSSTSPPAGRCGRTSFDAWRGKRTAAGPILGPEPPEQVRREPVHRPTPAELPPKEKADE